MFSSAASSGWAVAQLAGDPPQGARQAQAPLQADDQHVEGVGQAAAEGHLPLGLLLRSSQKLGPIIPTMPEARPAEHAGLHRQRARPGPPPGPTSGRADHQEHLHAEEDDHGLPAVEPGVDQPGLEQRPLLLVGRDQVRAHLRAAPRGRTAAIGVRRRRGESPRPARSLEPRVEPRLAARGHQRDDRRQAARRRLRPSGATRPGDHRRRTSSAIAPASLRSRS